MEYVALALAGSSALMQYQAGKEAKLGYDQKAKFKELEGRVEGVKAKEQGNKALNDARRALAKVTASARSGGLEPNIGTPVNFGQFNILKPAFQDFATARDNQLFIKMQTKVQAEDLRRAGREAKAQGVANALGTLSAGIMNYQSIGGPPADTTSTTTRTSGDYSRSTVPSARYGGSSSSSSSSTRFKRYGE